MSEYQLEIKQIVDYTLTVTDYEQDTMSFDRQFSNGYEHPTHLTKMAYTLEPELTNMQFSVSRSTAYRIIKQLNDQLEKKGKIIVAGKISARYFYENVYL